MKCFHFTNGEKEGRDDGGVVSRTTSKVSSWARSLSMASSALEARRSEFDSDSRDSLEFLTQRRRANDLRVFTFAELKTATRGFSRGLIVGEGGFGCVYRGVVTVSECGNGPDSNSKKIDVAIKQLDRNGFQACSLFIVLCLWIWTYVVSIPVKKGQTNKHTLEEQSRERNNKRQKQWRTQNFVPSRVRITVFSYW